MNVTPSKARIPTLAVPTDTGAVAAAAPTPAAPAKAGVAPQGAVPAYAPAPRAELSAGVLAGGHAGTATRPMNLRMVEVDSARLTAPVELSAEQKAAVVTRKATCPFMASAVNEGALKVRNNADTPLASVDDVAALGNTGGGNLGEVLRLFARGNHVRMPTDGNGPAPLTPHGHFSLDFPGSQGSHAGHSGILQGDPTVRNSGRLSTENLDRLLSRAKDGYLSLDDIGAFIAENVRNDPNAKTLGRGVLGPMLGNVGDTLVQSGAALKESVLNIFRDDAHDTFHESTRLYENITRTLGEDNLVGSAGEFGLLVALLQNAPHSRNADGEVALRAEDVRMMFVDKRMPEGWENWPKTRHDWLVATTRLTVSAAAHYHHDE